MKVKAIPFNTIEKWNVEQTGLPPRVVNCARKKGIRTFGSLQRRSDEELLAIRAMGRSSVAVIRDFTAQAKRLAAGELAFDDVMDVFTKFLRPFEREVLSDRYGLQRTEAEAHRNYYKLQEIANRRNLTRERVRQVEENALEVLRSLIVTACLQPFVDFVVEEIERRSGVVAFSDLRDLNPSALTKVLNPSALALLFCDLAPDRLHEDGACISMLDGAVLKSLRQELLDALNRKTAPCNAQSLAEEVHQLLPFSKGVSVDAIRRMLETDSRVLTLANHTYLCSKESLAYTVSRVMLRLSSPAHFREISRVTNQRLMPESRRGAGFYLRLLNNSPQFSKENFGFYRLLE